MSESPATDLATALTGLCTFLVQGPPFDDGDEVEVIFARDAASKSASGWLPINATVPTATRDALTEGELDLGEEVALVRADLARTGGFPRDSMNLPADEYDPDALTLTDVRVLDHRPSPGRSPPDDVGG